MGINIFLFFTGALLAFSTSLAYDQLLDNRDLKEKIRFLKEEREKKELREQQKEFDDNE